MRFILLAFACNTKSFETVFLVFSLFFLPFGQTGKNGFWRIFHHSFSKTYQDPPVTRDLHLFLGTVANVFVKIIFILRFKICQCDMSCALKNTSNCRIKRTCRISLSNPLKTLYIPYHNVCYDQTASVLTYSEGLQS